MSRETMPGATVLLLPEADEQGSYTKTQLIYHSTGTKAGARANRSYFAGRKVAVESTFIVDYDGEVVQIMPATARADANGTANKRAISVEVVGTGDEPYTEAQIASCIAIAKWACDEHQVARRRIPSESESGIGWHVMFGAPGPWTSAAGKVCPGAKRIAQIRNVIIPAVQQPHPIAAPPTPPGKAPTMFLCKDPKSDTQYLLSGNTRKQINSWPAYLAYLDKGVPVIELDAAELATYQDVTA